MGLKILCKRLKNQLKKMFEPPDEPRVKPFLRDRVFRMERWAFSKKELKNPAGLNSHDELIAYISEDVLKKFKLEDYIDVGIIIYRNGEVTNRFDDGTIGVPNQLQRLAEEEETLYHPNTNEVTEGWYDVLVDGQGNFIDFVRS